MRTQLSASRLHLNTQSTNVHNAMRILNLSAVNLIFAQNTLNKDVENGQTFYLSLFETTQNNGDETIQRFLKKIRCLFNEVSHALNDSNRS